MKQSGRTTLTLNPYSEVMGNADMVHRKWEIVWLRVIVVIIIHIAALWGAYLSMTMAKWQTCVFAMCLHYLTILGVTAGAHRLWSHKSYKATLQLRIILLILYTMALQNSVIVWVKNHRLHHKYSDTDADPHNSRRGFFFSHLGWMLVRRHPEVKSKIKEIDVSDLYADPLLHFQHKFFPFLGVLAGLTVTFIPVLWGEEFWIGHFVALSLRFTISTNITALVNSAAHMWGTHPYDKHIRPVDLKLLSFLTAGEGSHNYHHTFPWDYRTAEFGYSLNHTKLFIEIMAKIGWAYDLKSVPKKMIEGRVKRTGDGTHPVWGWNDRAILKEEETGSHAYRSSPLKM